MRSYSPHIFMRICFKNSLSSPRRVSLSSPRKAELFSPRKAEYLSLFSPRRVIVVISSQGSLSSRKVNLCSLPHAAGQSNLCPLLARQSNFFFCYSNFFLLHPISSELLFHDRNDDNSFACVLASRSNTLNYLRTLWLHCLLQADSVTTSQFVYDLASQ